MSRESVITLIRDERSPDAMLLSRGLETTLRHVGIPHIVLNASDVESGGLKQFRLAIVPCGGPLQPIDEFVRRGGKVLLGLNSQSDLLALLGLKRLKIKEARAKEMVFTHKALHGLPPRIFLSTRQIGLFKANADLKSLAHWHALENLTINDPAAYVGTNGALLTTALPGEGEHTQFSQDRVHLGRFIAALANHFLHDFDLLGFQRRLTEQSSNEEELVHHAPPRDFEVRGLWLPHIPDPNECARIARNNLNLICPNLGAVAARHYQRLTFQRPWSLADPLTKCADQAHRSGLEIMPYVMAWPLPSAEEARFFDGTGRLLKSNRQSTIGNRQSSMCPTHPENQQLLIEALITLLDEFGLDGLTLGGLRFPDEFSCHCEGCQKRFADYLEGKVRGRILNSNQRQVFWQNWRCEVMTDVLKRLLTAFRATNPNAKLAIATLPSWDRIPKRFGQDPVLWTQQQLADVIVPLNFTDQPDILRAELSHQLSRAAPGVKLCAGLGVYSHSSEIASGAGLVHQIDLARDLEADGFVIWHSQPGLFEEHFVEDLRVGALHTAARLPWHPNATIRQREERSDKARKAPRHQLTLPTDDC